MDEVVQASAVMNTTRRQLKETPQDVAGRDALYRRGSTPRGDRGTWRAAAAAQVFDASRGVGRPQKAGPKP